MAPNPITTYIGPTPIPQEFQQREHKVFLTQDKVSMQQLVQLAEQAGFKGEDAAIAASIAAWESSRYVTHYNPESASTGNNFRSNDTPPGEGSYGLWQIYRRWHQDLATKYNLLDPLGNALAAHGVYTQAGNSFQPWTGYWTGGYKQFLPEAEKFLSDTNVTPVNTTCPPAGDITKIVAWSILPPRGSDKIAPGQTFTLRQLIAMGCIPGASQVAGAADKVGSAVGDTASNIASIGGLASFLQTQFSGPNTWFNVGRLSKLILGGMLIMIAIVAALLSNEGVRGAAGAVAGGAVGGPAGAGIGRQILSNPGKTARDTLEKVGKTKK